MKQADVFRTTVETLERLHIPHMVVGSAASSIYGDPRMTRDIVIEPTSAQIDQLCNAFPARDFYVSQEAAQQALAARSQFNIIHPDSGNKIDLTIAGQDAWGRAHLARRRRAPLLPGLEGTAAAPEDVIIAKMIYYREGGSEKQLRDITGMLKLNSTPIDREDVEKWANSLGLTEIWNAVLARL